MMGGMSSSCSSRLFIWSFTKKTGVCGRQSHSVSNDVTSTLHLLVETMVILQYKSGVNTPWKVGDDGVNHHHLHKHHTL